MKPGSTGLISETLPVKSCRVFYRRGGNGLGSPFVVKLTKKFIDGSRRRVEGVYKSAAFIASHNKSSTHFIVNSR